MILNVPLTPEFREVRRWFWKIMLKEGLSDYWDELPYEFRHDQVLMEILSEDGRDPIAAIESVWIEMTYKHPENAKRYLIDGIPKTPEFKKAREVAWGSIGIGASRDFAIEFLRSTPRFPEFKEARKEAWRKVFRLGLSWIWHKIPPEMRRDRALIEVFAEEGESPPEPMSWEFRLGGGSAFDADANAYLHLGIDLRWKPIHFEDDRLHLGAMIGLDADSRSYGIGDGHDVGHVYGSGKLGATLQWSSSNIMLGATPFLSAVNESRTDHREEDGESTPIDSAWRAGLGMEISAQYMRSNKGEAFSPYLGFGMGFFASYAYRRLLGRKLGSSADPTHQVSGGLAFLF